MSHNLLRQSWIPVAGPAGDVRRVTVAEAVAGLAPGWRIGWPRADFSGATHEVLIGLLHLTDLLPADDDAWAELWEAPPTVERVTAALAPLVPQFELDGPGPRVLQDPTAAEGGKPVDIAALLIDSPGENALTRNMDIFVKRGRAGAMCPDCAAMALITMQSYAPSGGQGHRTSLRGGGPLTTLVTAEGAGRTLWHTLWANVMPRDALEDEAGGDPFAPGPVLPWTAPLRLSEAEGSQTKPHQAPFLQAFFGQPRRIWLDFEASSAGDCALCGRASDRLVGRMATKPRGVNYEGGWRHPLSPYGVEIGKPETYAARKGSPAGQDYRDWLGLVETPPRPPGGKGRVRVPALAVEHFRARAKALRLNEPLRLWAYGYDTDNMKARGWNDSRMPLHPQARDEADFVAAVSRAVAVADEALNGLTRALRVALVGDAGEAKAEFLPQRATLVDATRDAFFALLEAIARRDTAGESIKMAEVSPDIARWHKAVATAALGVFDDAVAATPFGATEAFDRRAAGGEPRQPRWVRARNDLIAGLWGKQMEAKAMLTLRSKPRETAA